mmetsp:Transcript_2030/g.2407  ORF Transcript_2030/g.2407 Transcript_2030/m.2407 type:complete len:95 (+) Transcript_2030:105-389(+)
MITIQYLTRRHYSLTANSTFLPNDVQRELKTWCIIQIPNEQGVNRYSFRKRSTPSFNDFVSLSSKRSNSNMKNIKCLNEVFSKRSASCSSTTSK